MPSKPKVPCQHPDCAERIQPGEKFCEKHKPLHKDELRPGAAKRGYGRAWQKARKQFLNAHPLCEECMKNGRYVKATDVDHIIAHRGDEKLFRNRDNWRALCHSCHSKKTAKEDLHPEYHY